MLAVRSSKKAGLAAAAVLSLAGAALAAAPSSPAQAAGEPYVALGDSYSSGVGTRAYIDDGSDCSRSTYAYPSLVAAAKGYSLNFRACSGAVVADVQSSQLSALSSSTKYVTISVGGNDIGFADTITECALPAWASDCAGAIADANSIVTNTLPGRLSSLYSAIKADAPNAKVVVVGYPKLFMGEDCNALTFFSPEDETAINNTATLLDNTIASAASAKGFTFINPISAFTGHAVCDSPEWINGLSDPVSESYHPNRDGQASGYTPLVSGKLTGASVAATSSVLAAAEAAGPAQAKLQRTYAAQDRHIEPEEIRIPTEAQLKRLAKEKGVDYEAWKASGAN